MKVPDDNVRTARRPGLPRRHQHRVQHLNTTPTSPSQTSHRTRPEGQCDKGIVPRNPGRESRPSSPTRLSTPRWSPLRTRASTVRATKDPSTAALPPGAPACHVRATGTGARRGKEELSPSGIGGSSGRFPARVGLAGARYLFGLVGGRAALVGRG